MLQKKLVIAMCAIFALSACGGDDNDDQTRIVLNPPEDINPPVEEEEEEEDDGSVEWLNATFDEEASIDSWTTVCVTPADCGATATLAFNTDAQAMDVTPAFLTAEDQLEVSTAIDPEIADLANGNAHLNLFVPEAYAGMVAQVFFQDASDRKGYIGYTNTTAGWNTFSFEALEAGTGVDGDYGSFGFHSEGFDLTLINRMGVQIQSAAGYPDLDGTLHIDDAIVSPEAIEVADKGGNEEPVVLEPLASGDESFTFDSDVQGWSNDSSVGSTVGHDANAGALVITPDWANADEAGGRPKAMGVTTNVVSEATFRMIVTVTQAQIDAGMGVQPYIQQNAGDYAQSFGPVITDLVAGDNLITYTAGELADAMRIAVQLVGPVTGDGESDTVLIKQVEIDLPGASTPANTQSVPVDSGWTNDTNDTPYTSVTYNNGVVITPDWSAGDQQKAFGVTSPVDVTDATVTYVVDVPEAYVTDGGMVIQPFLQQNSGSYTGIFDGSIPGGWNPASGLVAGENTIVFGPFTAPPADIARFGLNLLKQDKADGVTGDVTVKSVTITFPE